MQYEEGVVGKSFKAHMERFVLDIRKAGEAPLFPELVWDFVNLYRNVLVQLMFIRDPEKSKNIHYFKGAKDFFDWKRHQRWPS